MINKVGGTVDRVNRQLDKLDTATDSAVDAVEAVDEAVRTVSFAVKRPVAEARRASPPASRTASRRCARSRNWRARCDEREGGRRAPRGRLRGGAAQPRASATPSRRARAPLRPHRPDPPTARLHCLPRCAHDCRAARGLPALLRGARASARAVALADPARRRPVDALHRRRDAAVQAVLPRPARAAGASASSASRRCCAPAARTPTSRTSAAPTATARSSRCSATSRSATTSRTRRSTIAWEFVTRADGARPRPALGDRPRGRPGARPRRGHGRDRGLEARRDPARADRAARQGQLLAGRRHRAVRAVLGDLLRPRARSTAAAATTAGPGCECDRYMEFYNLVFMEYDLRPGHELVPLPNQNVDTGLGARARRLPAPGRRLGLRHRRLPADHGLGRGASPASPTATTRSRRRRTACSPTTAARCRS